MASNRSYPNLHTIYLYQFYYDRPSKSKIRWSRQIYVLHRHYIFFTCHSGRICLAPVDIVARTYCNHLWWLTWISDTRKNEIWNCLLYWVKLFITIKIVAKQIRADYLIGSGKNTGIIATLFPHINQVCDLLNEKLRKFREQWNNKFVRRQKQPTNLTESTIKKSSHCELLKRDR